MVPLLSLNLTGVINVHLNYFFSATPVRLRGPSNTTATGRVEVFYNGQWGTVCDNDWDHNNARVVCRQLGYSYGLKALQGDDVPDGTGKIWLSNVNCTGNEQNLSRCSHGGWGNNDCQHSEDAGVECSNGNTSAFRVVFLHNLLFFQFFQFLF